MTQLNVNVTQKIEEIKCMNGLYEYDLGLRASVEVS